MLALFSLRLAFGMLACLPLLPPAVIHPRFYRTHLLTALGLTCLALAATYDRAIGPLFAFLLASMVLTFVGSVLWQLDGAPGGQAAIFAAILALGASVYWLEAPSAGWQVLLGDAGSAALLGAAMSAMLMGHSYLIAPGMSLGPLNRLLALLAVAVLARMALDGYVLQRWFADHAIGNLGNDMLLWLPVRWLVGFFLPLGLCWMAWQSARIRSTQSATGILYVVVIFAFLGELTALLLRDTAGLTM